MFLMTARPPKSSRTEPLFPYTTRFRSRRGDRPHAIAQASHGNRSVTPPDATRADQLREPREIFEYARAHGLTLLEAKDAMARERWKAAQGRQIGRAHV